MANTERTALPPRPRSRKSIAHMPSLDTIDKENVTTDLSALRGNNKNTKAGKKSRSKSIGPGGLDGLIEGSGNARRKAAAAAAIPPVRSILKPTIPLSPLRQIPERKPTGKNAKTDSPKKAQNSGLPGLLDFAMMAFGPGKNSAVATEAEDLPGPFEGGAIGTRVTLRTEEEQQAAAREREEQEQKSADKERRDARRKSLANRRVSFAPEATLHTWDVVEYVGDSTTSSASTNSTRRASSVSAPSPHPSSQPQVTSSDASEPPSTPPDHVEDPVPAHSPAHQRDLHQRKRRRQSSAILPMNSHEPNTEFGSSPLEGSSIVGSDEETFVTADGEENSDSDVEQDEESVVIEDGDDTMNQSIVSARSTSSSNGSSGRLDEALRLAARQAGTQGIDFDENGDLSMEFDNTGSFKPHKGPVLNPLAPIPASQDQENQNPFSPAFGAGARPSSPEATAVEDGDVEMSMDMTKAIGGILPAHQSPLAKHGRRKSVVPNRRQSIAARRRSSGEGSSMGDETMELTMAVGGIQGEGPQDDHLSALDEDEEMTMELTSVIGGLIQGKAAGGRSRRKSYAPNDHQMADQQLFNEVQRRQSLESVANDETMDMTMAVGGIIPSQQEASIDDDTMGMDITQAIGSILPPQPDPRRSQAKAIMEVEADMGELASSPFHEQPLPGSPPKSAVPAHLAIVTSSTGSPSLATQQPRTSGRRSVSARKSTTPRAATSNAGTPIKKPTTPSKQITPKPARPTTPGKTPPQKNITFRSASPKKLFKEELKQAGHTPRSATPRKVFSLDAKTGLSTPSIVLTPKPRRSSGLGVDREGLGSPRVAALLDRRRSIGDDVRTFASVKADGSRAIRFEDPRELERELEKEREEEEQRENGRTILEREADIQEPQAKDATLNLKEMIESLTPKKKVAGRKSLHVGAAKGLLGKRPAELDGDEEEERGSAKKLRQSSPVKPVALRPPPSKTETAGRITRSTRGSLAATAGNARPSTPLMSTTPQKDARITTPKSQGKFKNAEALSSAARPPRPFGKKMDEDARDSVADDEVEEELEEKDEKIHLQEFLNMTSIRFMDLTTTKRRHTTAPNNMDDGKRRPENAADLGDDDSAKSFEKCVVAGACTLPMLELYQHSCHELKKYISEGRSIVREIEADTFEENPPLFREYISAAPDVKFIMDNQFKNVKTHARLLSKAMWYEWRMKLLEGLREGLVRISDGIDSDNQVLKEQEQLLAPIVPRLVEEHYNLESEHQQLSNQAAELASCDQEELTETRNKLVATENDIAAKKKLIQEIQESIKEKDQGIVAARERKQTCLEDIKEAEKIREECRGWSNSEVGILKGSADALEEKYGWTISAVEGTTITMTYRRDLQLVFDIASFLPNEGYAVPVRAQNSPISVTYIADTRELRPEPLSTEKRFFLQNLKAHLQGMHQANTHVKDLLHLISNVWQAACDTAEQIRVLDLCCSTKPQIISDNGMRVESKMLLPTLATKVRVLFNLTLSVGGNIAVQVTPDAKVVYGESLNEGKMKEFLNVRIKGVKNVGHWEKAVEELRGRLVVRGKK